MLYRSDTIDLCEGEKTSLRTSILRALLYFDLFRHALTFEEIVAASDVPVESTEDVQRELRELLFEGVIRTARGFYWVGADPTFANLRLVRSSRAADILPEAMKYVERMARFPFVRGILITGSMSHRSMDERNDVDYLVLTEPGRLWISRSLLMLYKKIFLHNACAFWCINYLIDTEHLEIQEKNLFTATELAAAIPVYGSALCKRFLAANDWLEEYLPNATPGARTAFISERKLQMKKVAESIFNAPIIRKITDRLDSALMRFTEDVWNRKFGTLAPDRFELQFRTRKYASKHHPKDYQNKVLLRLDQRIRAFELEHGQISGIVEHTHELEYSQPKGVAA